MIKRELDKSMKCPKCKKPFQREIIRIKSEQNKVYYKSPEYCSGCLQKQKSHQLIIGIFSFFLVLGFILLSIQVFKK